MFCPVGYVSWSDIKEVSYDWASRIIFAERLEAASQDPRKAFEGDAYLHSSYWLSKILPLDDIAGQFKEVEFSKGLLTYCILAKLMMEYDTLLSSSSGEVMRAPFPTLIHADRFDWCYWTWPLRETGEFKGIFELFDQEQFEINDLDERFCCLDGLTGTISIKNNSVHSLHSAMHMDISEADTQRLVDRAVKPFSGWAITWKSTEFPESQFELFSQLGIAKDTWRSSIETFSKPKIGRPKFQKAFDLFAEMNFERGNMSWKELINLIGSKTGEWPHEATYRSWVRDNVTITKDQAPEK